VGDARQVSWAEAWRVFLPAQVWSLELAFEPNSMQLEFRPFCSALARKFCPFCFLNDSYGERMVPITIKNNQK